MKNLQSEACSPASVALTSGSSEPVGKHAGKLRLIPSTKLSLPIDFRKPKGSSTSDALGRRTLNRSTASSVDSRAKTSPRWESGRESQGNAPGSSMRPCESSKNCDLNGWSLRTSRACSLAAVAKTLNESCKRLPSGGMWDFGGCLMLDISECPKVDVGFSWLQVIEPDPHWSCWLMPQQWTQYLARLQRNGKHGKRMHGVGPTLCRNSGNSQIGLGGELFVAQENGWNKMVDRQRISKVYGVPAGLDKKQHRIRQAAGNAVVPACAEWIARHLITFSRHRARNAHDV